MIQRARSNVRRNQAAPVYPFYLAATHGIGTVMQEYKSNTGSKMFWGIVLVTIGVILTVLGVLLLLVLFTTGFGSAVFAGIALVVTLVVTGLAFFINHGIAVIRRARRNRGAAVYLCADGLLHSKNGGVEVIRWDQIAQVWRVYTVVLANYGQKAYMLSQFLLRRPDGTALLLDNAFHRFKEMGAQIEQQVVNRLLPGALTACRSGYAVAFGPIAVQQQGVSVEPRKDLFSWNEIDKVRVAAGLITFRKKGPPLVTSILATVPLGKVPNAGVLAALIEHLAPSKVIYS
ncbi:MAG: hypothetical protein NVSMB27_16440 [Ktedonobacteraceae bacterium]